MKVSIDTEQFIGKTMIPYYRARVAQIIADALVKNCPAHIEGSLFTMQVPEGKDWEAIIIEAVETAAP